MKPPYMMVMPSRRNVMNCSISSLFDFISLSPYMPRVSRRKTAGIVLKIFLAGGRVAAVVSSSNRGF
jgi:hypothetical protein